MRTRGAALSARTVATELLRAPRVSDLRGLVRDLLLLARIGLELLRSWLVRVSAANRLLVANRSQGFLRVRHLSYHLPRRIVSIRGTLGRSSSRETPSPSSALQAWPERTSLCSRWSCRDARPPRNPSVPASRACLPSSVCSGHR